MANSGDSSAVEGVADQGRAPGAAVDILGVSVHDVDFAQTLAIITGWIEEAASSVARPAVRQICTVNPEFIMEAKRNGNFDAALARAHLRVADGVGVLWAARLLGSPLRERVTGSDGIDRICELAARRGWRVYFLGAAPGVARQAADLLADRYPGLTVAGCHAGSPSIEDWPAIRQRLAVARPDLLFVAYGHPQQDLWIDRHRGELPATVAMGVGGAFDFVAGVQRRAPLGMQRLGLEWLYRLLREPRRWRRMRVLPLFVLLVLRQWSRSG